MKKPLHPDITDRANEIIIKSETVTILIPIATNGIARV